MILEAQQIYEALCEANVDMSIIHGDIYRPGKDVSLRVELSDDGKEVSSIHFLDKEQTSRYWTLGDNNKNRFPVSKLEIKMEQKQIKSKSVIKEWKARKQEFRTQELNDWIQEYFPSGQLAELDPNFQNRLNERTQALAKLSETNASRFLELLKIFSKCSNEQYLKWVSDILGKLKKMSFDSSEHTEIAQNILVTLAYTSRPPTGSKAKNEAAVTVIWDLEKKGLDGMQAVSPTYYSEVSKVLLENEAKLNNICDSEISCSITGDTPIEKKTFPNPALGNLGPTRLYSRNKAAESFHRYGQHGANAFPLGEDHSKKLEAALSALTIKEREGKTWSKVSSSSSTKPDLLMVYQASLADQQFASALGTDQSQVNEAGFEEICRRFIERTKGKSNDQLRGKLFLAVLRAVDTANSKIIFHKNLSIKSMEESATLWQSACKNFVSIKLPIPVEKGKPALLMSPPVLNPGSLPSLTKTFHFLDGRTADSPGGISFPDAMQILLSIQTPDSKLVKRCLSIIQRRLAPLLQRTAAIQYRAPSEIYKMKGDLKWNILKAQSLFSLLITSSNRTPKQVMKSIAYQLGQLCAAYDQIHAGYCHQERGGDLPPKLLGNICFQSANRNPTAALSQLSQRAAPHLAWVKEAKRVEAKNDKFTEAQWAVIHAKSAYNNLNEYSPSIHTALLSNEAPLDDLFRAELVLGYLAGYPKKEQPTDKEIQKDK